MPLELKKIDKQKVGFFQFKRLNGQYLLTNVIGDYIFLKPSSFDAYLCGKIEQTSPQEYSELQNKGFIRSQLDFDSLAQRYARKNMFLSNGGPSLHIVVVTLRCDHRCVYCQAGSQDYKAKELDMDIATAEKVVDIIFESPNKNITIEFQGGEPLINFETIKFIVKYAQKKNKEAKKDLMFTVVSNLTFINEKIVKFLLENRIHICTSLDGPEKLHNKCRIALGNKNSYKHTVKWLKILKIEYKKKKLPFKPSALATITRFSLPYAKEIINEYGKLRLKEVHLRPLSPFGTNRKLGDALAFSAREFIAFYKQALDYIIDLNMAGKDFCERSAAIFLTKILTDKDPDYLDLRSPCGAGIGQLAYNFNGDVYTCDEGRMLSRVGDESFRLGNVKENSYQDISSSEIVKTLGIASCLDNLSGCSQCVYKPYCGICPLYNYAIKGNLFNNAAFPCEIKKAILDYLFIKLEDKKIKNIFYKWVTKRSNDE
ncbi:MAG: His-Xaa-Ser system radical SAM maturase HxsB [Candidatus Omnitrophota bacterium]